MRRLAEVHEALIVIVPRRDAKVLRRDAKVPRRLLHVLSAAEPVPPQHAEHVLRLAVAVLRAALGPHPRLRVVLRHALATEVHAREVACRARCRQGVIRRLLI
jgi:hypothetical protein